MNILITILIGLACIIALLLIYGLFGRNVYNVRNEVIIKAPAQKVFDYLKLLRNQDNFNKWVMVDPGMKRDYKGVDGTAGFIYNWNGNKQAGEGELEIKNTEEGKRIETEIRFVRPMPGIARANWVIEPVSNDQTKVRWNNEAKLKYPFNIMITMIEKMLSKDMDTSLNNLKEILER